MVMRYFGGGIGHLKNTPPQQVPGYDPIDPTSEEMAVEEDEDLGTIVQQPSNDDKDEDDSDSDEGGDQTDEEEDSEGEDSEGEDDYGYASA
jgi:hypothetical protein